MDFLRPILLYAAAIVIPLAGLYLPISSRKWLLVPVWGFLALSMNTSHYLRSEWYPTCSIFNMLVVITGLLSPICLHIQDQPLRMSTDKHGRRNLGIKESIRMFKNPRMIQPIHKQRCTGKTQTRYFLLRCLGIIALNVPYIFAVMTAQSYILADCSSSDFDSSHEQLVRRFVAGLTTPRELGMRMFLTLNWILDMVMKLESFHSLLGIFFVFILRVDDPSEWPPLFGNPLDAYSVKRFWSKFWHQLFSPSAIAWGHFVSQRLLNLHPRSRCEKVFVAFFVFTLSGAVHGLLDEGPELLNPTHLLFAWTNFAVISAEIVLYKAISSLHIPLVEATSTRPWAIVWGRILGLLWVWCFLVWILPELMYPKLFEEFSIETEVMR